MPILTRLLQLVDQDQTVVLVTIEHAAGSTPREAGAAMLVMANGDFHGSIGGGALEWEALHLARSLFEPGRPPELTRDFSLGPELSQCCGGRVRLALRRLTRNDRERIATLVGDETATPLALFGAGHVGRALVLALAPLPFQVDWLDQRVDVFPAAVPANVTKRAPGDLTAAVDTLRPGTFVLVMTHSHPLDLAIVARALTRDDFPFVGLIGSATKRARFLKQMADAGILEAARARLICPVGIAGIDGKEPAVIAASMTAALLVARHNLMNRPA